MGRPRNYDEAEVLTRAMHAFRRHGYGAISIRDLEKATGLTAGTIYNSYTDKAGLFTAAFAHYNRAVLGRRLAQHAPAEAGLEGLRRLFLTLAREPDDESFGCLITNAAIEFGGGSAMPAGVKDGLAELEDTFRERLAAARGQGRLRPGIVPRVAARKLLALYQGILVLVRAGYDKRALEVLVRHEFDQLETPSL